MEKNDTLLLELRKLGLNEKESKVYLTSLETGPISIQRLAPKVEMSRPTAYRIFESLERMGLMRKAKQGGKSLVVAESPDELLGLLRSEKRKVEEKEREFLRIISVLQAKHHRDNENEIKQYKGREGRKLLLDDFSFLQSKKILVVITSEEKSVKRELSSIYKDIEKRLGKIEVKELHCQAETTKPRLEFIDRKFIPRSAIGFPCPELLIIADKVIFLGKKEGLLIEQKDTVRLFQGFFETIWKLS